MIGRLRGEVASMDGGLVLLDVGGVGYEVAMAESDLVAISPFLDAIAGETVTIWVRQVFREDGVSLYGFLEIQDRRLFDLLTEVKGCGPRIAQSLLGVLGGPGVSSAIIAQDARSLTRASGVGPKLAERILLELKTKVAEDEWVHRANRLKNGQPPRLARPDDPLVEALLALGYRRNESEQAAALVSPDGVLEDRLRQALRSLQR